MRFVISIGAKYSHIKSIQSTFICALDPKRKRFQSFLPLASKCVAISHGLTRIWRFVFFFLAFFLSASQSLSFHSHSSSPLNDSFHFRFVRLVRFAIKPYAFIIHGQKHVFGQNVTARYRI